MNLKKTKAVISICLYGFFLILVGCDNKFPIKPDLLIGKSKREVIALSMEFAERNNSNKVNFAAQNEYGHFENYYYSSKSQAEQDKNLLRENVWRVFFTKQNTLFGYHRKFIQITFKNGYVYKFEINTISDGF